MVRAIAPVWHQMQPSRNAQDIAKRGAALYDTFVGFAVDLSKVGDYLAKVRGSDDEARGKLIDGSGNLVRQVEMLRELGVRPTTMKIGFRIPSLTKRIAARASQCA